MRTKIFGSSSFWSKISGITTNFFARMKICNVIMHNGLLLFKASNGITVTLCPINTNDSTLIKNLAGTAIEQGTLSKKNRHIFERIKHFRKNLPVFARLEFDVQFG